MLGSNTDVNELSPQLLIAEYNVLRATRTQLQSIKVATGKMRFGDDDTLVEKSQAQPSPCQLRIQAIETRLATIFTKPTTEIQSMTIAELNCLASSTSNTTSVQLTYK